MVKKNSLNKENKTLLNFPCEFIFKIVGLAQSDFEGTAVSIMRKHFPKMSEAAVQHKLSREGKYLSLSIRVIASSQAELDAAYQELSQNESIIFVL
ncbi:MAG TPA: DUF493 domain-containing protein [Gammaproteobacteria bacterium]|nr:DUF493 domain-containing protein [Gammaproteobacteria bacterium]